MNDDMALASFGADLSIAVIGASGGIGGAFVEALEPLPAVSHLYALSRSAAPQNGGRARWHRLDLLDEGSIAAAAAAIKKTSPRLHLVIVATGMLHAGDRAQPEKTWRSLEAPAMEIVFQVNTIGPALVAKHFLPLLDRDRKSVFAALSARVGSIEDNHLGGWHAYRASKAALNMLIKNFSIELARRNANAVCVGLHPGTVDTGLSKPFQANVESGKLFPAAASASHLLRVLDGLTPQDSGALFAWNGERIPF